MNATQSYQLIEACQASLVEKGSKFIALAYPCPSLIRFKQLLASQKEAYADATHLTYAYIVRDDSGLHIKCSDDGEPSGTAGRPILNHLEGRNLINVCLFVVRYFGGTKLGAGGLVRAYGGSARLCLDLGAMAEYVSQTEVRTTISYDQQRNFEQACKKFHIQILDAQYGEKIHYELRIPEEDLKAFSALWPIEN